MKSLRLTLERLGIALITVLALGGPLALGAFTYLALGDGFDIAAGDPLRAARIWLIKENRRFTTLAFTMNTAEAPAGAEPGLQCARIWFTALRWSPELSLERTAGACTCYAAVDGALRQSRTPCAQP
jgi:hypothetical protein